jgi:hypothetical protein
MANIDHVEAAHIYPYTLVSGLEREPDAVYGLWNHLEMFWSPERIQSWKAAIFRDPDAMTGMDDGCFNRICLGKQAHSLWGAGRFALRPVAINDDLTILKVQFFWQKRPSHRTQPIDLLTEPESSRDLVSFDQAPGYLAVFGNDVTVNVRSGDFFYIITDDADRKPLPSVELLEMQWCLHRVAGMSGAAEPTDEIIRDEEGEGDAGAVADRDAPIRCVQGVFGWLCCLPDQRSELDQTNLIIV